MPKLFSRCVAAGFTATLLACANPAAASTLVQQHCASPAPLSVAQQDRLLRFAAFIKSALDNTGQTVAIVARSGLNLSRFNLRYSHGGISLQASPNAPWSVRQLYYDCDTAQARLFDQGISGFVLGSDNPDLGFFSALLLPTAAANALLAQTLDKAKALQALHGRYSANAHAWSLRYQNCNQWLVETLALAWGASQASASTASASTASSFTAPTIIEQPPRAAAQSWLRRQGYQPQVLAVNNRLLMWVASALPWLHEDDHPSADLGAGLYRVSMPASVEAFVRQREPAAQRLEFCFNATQMVLREGWVPLDEECNAAPGDNVIIF